jgi:hypothetical protein
VAVENFDKFGESEERSGVYFDPRTIELQKKYAKDLLTHLNPYTGLRYCDDPAVAMIQVVNEDTLFLYGYWKTLKGHYKTLFQEKWNIWLAQRYKNLENLRAAWGSLLEPGEDPASKSVKFSFPVGMTMGTWGGKSSARLDDQTLFCYDMEADFYKEMKNYLRDIGVKCPVIGSQALFLNLPDLKAQTVMDVIDQHPYSFGLRPVVKTNCWDYDTITQMAVTKVFGKPIITTEWNYHHLDIFEFRCDAPLFVAAYSRFQDWDCMNAHGYNHATGGRLKRIEWNQNIFNDPAFIGQWQAAANIFLRGDVTPAKEFVDIGRYYNNTFYKREMCRPIKGFLPYVKGARTKFFDRDSTPEDLEKDRLYFSESLNFKTGDILISDTGELEWHHSAGVLKINTAKTQAAIGFLKDFGEVRLENLAVKAKTDGAVSASLTSLDNLPLSGSKKMLLTIVGRAENTGMKWDSSRFICKNKGAGPVMMEGVEADISIASGSAGKIKARALDKYGDRTLDVPCSEKDGAARFSVSREYKTMYYEITAD